MYLAMSRLPELERSELERSELERSGISCFDGSCLRPVGPSLRPQRPGGVDRPATYPQKFRDGVSIALAPETGSQLALLLIEWPSGWPIWETSGARIRVQALGVSLFVPRRKKLPPQPLLGRIFDLPATALNLWLGTGNIGPRRPYHRGAVFIQDLDGPA